MDVSGGPQSPWKEGGQMEVSDSGKDLFPCDLIGCWIYVAEVESCSGSQQKLGSGSWTAALQNYSDLCLPRLAGGRVKAANTSQS